MLLDKVERVEPGNAAMRSARGSIALPSVLKLRYYVKVFKRDIPLTKRNIIRRDGGVCQYCGAKQTIMTIDHVVPRSKGGKDEWKNMVCACPRCNSSKNDRTPSQAGMTLLHKPKRPRYFSFAVAKITVLPSEWKQYLFMD